MQQLRTQLSACLFTCYRLTSARQGALVGNPLHDTSQCRGNQRMEENFLPSSYDVAAEEEMQVPGSFY